MKKNIERESYLKRLQTLADVKKIVSESKTQTNNSSLISIKESSDGAIYGVVKENHDYFIKRSVTKTNPSISDFVYLNGIQNKFTHRYDTINKAEKNLDLLIKSINEGNSYKINKNSTKLILENTEITNKIDDIETKVDDLEDKTELDSETIVNDEIPTEPEINPNDETPTDIKPEPELGDETELELDDETSNDSDLNGDEMLDDMESDEIASTIGKVTNKIRNTELTPVQVKTYINTFLSAFKNSLPEVEIEDRQKMAKKILKVVDKSEIDDLENDVKMDENEMCSECGSFTTYVESMGYDKESIMDCDINEMANLISNYANAHNEGLNEGDFDSVALFSNNEINEMLKSEYGHDEYVEKLSEYFNALNENTDEEKAQKINELSWGGIKAVGNKMGQQIKKGVGDVTQQVKRGVENVTNKISSKIESTKNAIKDLGNEYATIYRKEEVNDQLKKLEGVATELGVALQKLNTASKKAGLGDVNFNSILSVIRNQVGSKGTADLSKYRVSEEILDDTELEISDETPVDVNPEIEQEPLNISPEITTPEDNTLDVSVDGINKRVEITLSESTVEAIVKNRINERKGMKKGSITESTKKSIQELAIIQHADMVYDNLINEQKIRKYVRARLNEKFGLKKNKLNESVKSKSQKKLDNIIDKHLTLYENRVSKTGKLNEDHIKDTEGRKKFIKGKLTQLSDSEIKKIYREVEKMLGLVKGKKVNMNEIKSAVKTILTNQKI